MKNNILLFIVLLFGISSLQAYGDDAPELISYPGGRCYMYRLTLCDKQGTPFSPERPWEFLSQKSLERRRRQHLPVDSTDLPLSPAYLDMIRSAGVDIVRCSKWNNTVLVRSRRHDLLRGLASLPCVRGIKKVWTSPDSIKPSNRRARWHKEFTRWDTVAQTSYGVTEEQIAMLGGIRMHNAGFTGSGMTIAVMDGGFMNADRIPALCGIRVEGHADFVVPPSQDIFKEIDHGTRVLSAMAVNVPDFFIGAAPDASYWLLRCEDDRTESLAEEDYWTAAAEFADSVGVDIINSSLGFHSFDDASTNYRYIHQDGHTAMISKTASMLARKGIVLVNSAGNDGMGAWKRINFPADATDMITVGAVTPGRTNAAFSSVGPTADGRVKPDVMAMGSPAAVVTGRGTISKDVGTSFSTPLVCGMTACLWQALRDKTALEIIDLVRRSGSNCATPDNIYGYGIPDFWKAYTMGKQTKGRTQ